MELRFDTENEALRAARDNDAFDRFASRHMGFILRCASRVCGRFVTMQDDAFETALLAFYEAVRAYAPDKGSFRSFAALVIKRRLNDQQRAQSRLKETSAGLTFEWDSDDAGVNATVAAVQKAVAQADTAPRQSAADEIDALKAVLRGYDIDFFALADASPRAGKTKRQCAEAVRWMLDRPDELSDLRRRRALPMKRLAMGSGVPVKTIERHRRYIVAAIEILDGDYPILSDYFRGIREGRA